MARCVSCGEETRVGEIFCERCLKQISAKAESAPPSVGAAAEKTADDEAERTAQWAEPTSVIDAGMPSMKGLTPPSQKRVISKGPASFPKKPEGRSAKRVSAPKSGERKVKVAKASDMARKRKAYAVPDKKERVKMKIRVGSKTITPAELIPTALAWLKKMALPKERNLDRLDRISFIGGILAAILALTILIFMNYYHFEWGTAGAWDKEMADLNGIDFGASGYLLITFTVLMLIAFVLELTPFRERLRVDLSFLAICLCIVAILTFFISINTASAVTGAAAKAKGYPTDFFKNVVITYSHKKALVGGYLLVVLYIILFSAGAIRLAERERGFKWQRKRGKTMVLPGETEG